jgi:hypothetical protein
MRNNMAPPNRLSEYRAHGRRGCGRKCLVRPHTQVYVNIDYHKTHGVREVILPRAGILTYDTWNATLEDVTKCGTNFYKHVWDCCERAMPILPRAMGVQLDDICTIFLESRSRSQNSS